MAVTTDLKIGSDIWIARSSFYYPCSDMRVLVISSIFAFSACSDAANDTLKTTVSDVCDISFTSLGPCQSSIGQVEVEAEAVEIDEKILQVLKVDYQGKIHRLEMTADTSMLDGDIGFIALEDINFDGNPDLSITTSFGLANLYLDYWVFDPDRQQFHYLGNYAKFERDEKNKTLSNVVKENAATYTSSTFSWEGLKLIRR